MTDFSHGGDILTAQNQYGGRILDFSANINPLGMPESVRLAAERAVSRSTSYPDPFCRELRKALSIRDGVPEDYILCGNGAADLIFRLVFARRPKKAMITAPAFSEYEQALDAVGCEVQRHLLNAEDEFQLTKAVLEEISPGLDMLFLCNPNNPTGQLIDTELLLNIIRACESSGTFLVLDECFIELSTGGQRMAHMLQDNSRLLLLRAFTKSYAMPGLRFGYCLCSGGETLQKLSSTGQPWSVSIPAQAAALAAAKLTEYPEKAREFIETERKWLYSALDQLGFTVFPSSVNFILFRAIGVFDLKRQMIEKGVLIRSCSNFPGLGPDYYRVAVRSRDENRRLAEALGACKGGGS